MFQVEFYTGYTKIVFADNKKEAYGMALGLSAGRVVRVTEIVIT
jgi:hypothetical protein